MLQDKISKDNVNRLKAKRYDELLAQSAADAETIKKLRTALDGIKCLIGNPSAWDNYDDVVSEKLRAILAETEQK
jgi:acetylglutamate kinase